MSVRRLAEIQPESFAFTSDNKTWAKAEIGKYPKGRQASAVIPLLWQAQKQHDGWLPEPAIRAVAEMLDMAYIRVLEVATFYTMFNLEPVGRHYVQLCGTTPCWLRGADDLKAVCRKVIGEPGHVSDDGAFSWIEVECLGACSNAPMVQINDEFYEDLTAESFATLLGDLRAGRDVKVGSQVGRVSSEPLGGPYTLTELDGKPAKPETKAKPASKPKSKMGSGTKPAPRTDEKPTTAKARHENAGKPSGLDTAETEASRTPSHSSAKPKPVEAALESVDRPSGLAEPEGTKDDLKRISGVGPKIEGTLNTLGIFHFRQIASWSRKNIEWVDGYLKFKGRIDRDDWISQAKTFAEGQEK